MVWKEIYQLVNNGYLGKGQVGDSDHEELHLYVLFSFCIYVFIFMCIGVLLV